MHRKAIAFVLLFVLTGLFQVNAQSVSAAPGASGYTCCNLRYDGDWISDANWTTSPFIPAGSKIELKEYGHFRAAVDINGRPMRIGQDYGRMQESKEQYMGKLIVQTDPKLKIATWPAPVQTAIRMGKVMQGMTREQVIVALGYPRTDENPALDIPEWRYRTSDGEQCFVIFNQGGLVQDVEAPTPIIKRLMFYVPQN